MAREQIKVTLLQTGEGSSAVVHSRELRNAELYHEHHLPQKSTQVPEEPDGATRTSAVSPLSSCPHCCPHQLGAKSGIMVSLDEVPFLALSVCSLNGQEREEGRFSVDSSYQSCFSVLKSTVHKNEFGNKVRTPCLPQH